MATRTFRCVVALVSGPFAGQFSWNNASNWIGGVPTSADDAVFDSASATASQIVNLQSANRVCNNLDMGAFAGTITAGQTYSIQVYGTSIILPAIGTSGVFDPNNNPGLALYSGTTTYLKTNGQTVGDISIYSGSTLNLASDLVGFSNMTLTIDNGTFDANNKNVTIGGFTDTSSSSNKTLTMGSGKWTLGGEGPANNAFTIWNIQGPSYFTLNKDTSTIRLVRYSGASSLYSDIGTSPTGTIKIVGALTQNTITNTTQFANWPSTGTILIDSEFITYTALATNANRNEIDLTIGSRGYNSTSTVGHSTGAAVLLVDSETTQLTSDITSSSTTAVPVTSTSGFGGGNPVVGFALVDDEVFYYRGTTSTTLGSTVVERGTAYGAAATKHKAGAKVYAVQTRIFNDGAKSYPPIEVWSTGAYYITNFTGNGTSSGGGITNLSFNNLGLNQVQFGTYMSPTSTYYQNKPQSGDSSGDFFETFWYRDRA